MQSYRFRPAQPDDVDVVCSLVINQQIADFGEAFTTEKEFHAQWERHLKERIIFVAFAPDDEQMLASISLIPTGDNEYYFVTYIGDVDDDESLCKALIDHARLAAFHRATPETAATVTLHSQVSDRNKILKRVVEDLGFASTVSFLMMQIQLDPPLSLPESITLPEVIQIREFRHGIDDEAVYQADEEANQDKAYYSPQTYEKWRKRMRMTQANFDPSLWLVAWEGDNIVGVGLNYIQDQIGWIDHLGVRRAWRKRGIGMALMYATYDLFDERGIGKIRLNVDAASPTNAPQLYLRAGMEIVNQYHIYTKVFTSPDTA